MGVANHLRIDLAEYDARIRTFVPHYETMLGVVADTIDVFTTDAPGIIDLGIGTGALSAACRVVRPRARILGIDADPGMLDSARSRLGTGSNVELRTGSFLDYPLPAADAMVACISLHHIDDAARKREFYRQAHASLRPGGLLINADYMPGSSEVLAARQHDAWLRHLDRSYTRAESEDYLAAWAQEDTFFPLESEIDWMTDAGFTVEVMWRQDGLVVLAGVRSGT